MKTSVTVHITLTLLLAGTPSISSKIMRNNALMTKMVSKFHKEPSYTPDDPADDPEAVSVVSKMQSVLCKNFPSIPCDVITQDSMLRELIEESVKQILKHKNENEGAANMNKKSLRSEEIQSYFKGIKDSKNRRKNVRAIPRDLWNIDQDGGNASDVRKEPRNSRKVYPKKGKGKLKEVVNKKVKMEKDKLTLSEEFPTLMRKESRRLASQQKDLSALMWGPQEEKRRNLNNVGFAAGQNRDKILRNTLYPGESNLEPFRSLKRQEVRPDIYLGKKTFVKHAGRFSVERNDNMK